MKQHIRSFSNDFRWIPELHNKNTLDIAWNIQYDRRPQGLLIRGDLTERFLGNQHLNQGIRQTVDVPRFHSHATLSYNPGTYGQIKHFYGLGVLNKRIRLRSDRSLISSSGDFHPDVNINPNNMDWKSDKVYLKGSYHYKQPSWEVDISLPLAWQRTRYADSALFSEKEDAGLLFEPHLRIKWELAAGNRLEFQYSRQNDFGSFTSVYQGPLLLNYRSIRKGNLELQHTRYQSAHLNYRYNNPVVLLFAYIKTGWQLGSSHFLPMHYFQEDIVSSGFIEYDNTRTTYFSEIGGSRYFPSVMTSFAMDFQYNHSRKVVFVQKQVLPFRSGRYVVHMRSETRLAPKLRLELDGTLQHSRYFTGASTGQSSNISNGIREFDIKGSLRYKASSRLFFSLIDRLIGESQYKQSIYNFLDLRARYQHSKWKMDFELALNNLGNLTEYRSVLVSDNRVSVSNYTLRGRNIRLFLRFNL